MPIEEGTKGRYFESYLGDGAYVYMAPDRSVVLFTSNGITETNKVYLEPEVLAYFTRWQKRVAIALLESEADDGHHG